MHLNEETKNEGGCCPGRRFWKFPFIIAAIIFVKSALVLVLWNSLVPDLFHGPLLTYFQAIKLTILAKLLVGFAGFRPFGGHHGPPWKHRWLALSPEEREKLREDIRKRSENNDS